MSETKIQSCAFTPLDFNGNNFLLWKRNMTVALRAQDLLSAVSDNAGNTTAKQKMEDAKALQIMLHHLDAGIQVQYMTDMTASALWNELNKRFNHSSIIRPAALNNWHHL